MLELVNKALQEGRRLRLVASIVVHLAAAGLARRELDRMTKPLEDAHDRFSRLRKQRVVIAGDEKRDSQGSPLRPVTENSIEILFPKCIRRQIR